MPNTRTHHSMGGLPIGTVLDFAGTTAPDGALLCFGQAVSRTTYAALFAVISTTFGAGDGTTTFNLPDARGRVCAGKDDMGGSAASRLTSGGSGVNGSTLGAVGGAQTHTLTEAQMPAHTHGTGGDTLTVSAGAQAVRYGNSLTTYATSSTGGGAAHNNTQPTIVLNKIIIFQ